MSDLNQKVHVHFRHCLDFHLSMRDAEDFPPLFMRVHERQNLNARVFTGSIPRGVFPFAQIMYGDTSIKMLEVREQLKTIFFIFLKTLHLILTYVHCFVKNF